VSKLQVFDPPMCCSTGVCGPSVDPALAQFASDLEQLKAAGVEVERFNLGQDPGAFVENPVVVAALRGRSDALPMVLLDGSVVSEGAYPARAALYALVKVAPPPAQLVTAQRCPPDAEATSPPKCC
jgi:hypothetical protein